MTHQEIIAGCKRGQEAAYRALVDQFAEQLMGVCMRYLRDRQKAEDAIQESYIQVFKSIHQFELTGSLGGWMVRIAVNNCLKALRKHERLHFTPEHLDNDKTQSLPDVYDKLNADDLLQLLDTLPAHYRVIFNLYAIEGYTHREIADMLGIAESLSRTKLTRARKLMQDYFIVQVKKSIV